MMLSIQHLPSTGNRDTPNHANQLLSLLPASELQTLLQNSNRIILPAKTTLYQPNMAIKTVYFPILGIISLLEIDREGLVAQTVAVSHEGMVGIPTFLGGHFHSSVAIVQTKCIAISLSAEILKQEFARSRELQRILLLYTQNLFSQVARNVFCSCHHTLEQRLARWLLFYSDRGGNREILLTQETLADLLGVRRSSLSVTANNLRQKNLIDYSRGRIIIRDPIALRATACECDRLISAEHSRLFGVRP